MKRNSHIIVQQVCPMKKTDDGKYEVQAAIVHHKGIIARYRMEYPTKRHARWAQHLICTVKNASRLNKGDSVTLWLYESGQYGTRGIIGKCRLVVTAGLRPYPPKGILEWTMNQACVTEEHLRNYLPCYVWGVQDPVRISTVPLSDIGMTRPPQSWQYLTDEQADILERRLA